LNLKNELLDQVKQSLKFELVDVVKSELKNELKPFVEQNIRNELSITVKNSLDSLNNNTTCEISHQNNKKSINSKINTNLLKNIITHKLTNNI
jgi:hypothetical protein